jgi:hypothetical protein
MAMAMPIVPARQLARRWCRCPSCTALGAVLLLRRRRWPRNSVHEDLALASAFGRLAVVHADEATIATNLRLVPPNWIP